MRRDMDLVREILLAVERMPEDPPLEPFTIPGYTDTFVQSHLALMLNAGLIEAVDDNNLAFRMIYPTALTWIGADMLDAIRDEPTWRTAKEYARNIGAATLPAFIQAVIAWATMPHA